MKRSTSYRSRLVLATVAFAVLGHTGSVAAQDTGAPPTESNESGEAYPAQLSLRPLTLRSGMTEAVLRGGYWWIDDESNIAPISMSAKVGITDRWDASVLTAFRLLPDTEWRDFVGLSTRVLAYDSRRIDVAPHIVVPINFDRAEDAHLLPAVTFSATTRIHLTERYSLILGDGLLPMSIGKRASMNFGCTVIAQGRPDFGIAFTSQLFHVRLSGDVRETGLGKLVPALTVFYSIDNWIDFSVTPEAYSDAKGLFGRIAIRR